MDASETPSDDAPRIIPDGWVAIGAALGCVTFGSATEPRLRTKRIYLGATGGSEAQPEWVTDELRYLVERGEKPFSGPLGYLSPVEYEARKMLIND